LSKFRKKPVVVDAVKILYHEWADDPFVFEELPDWLDSAITMGVIRPEFRSEDYWYLVIDTLEGPMSAGPDDWIIRDVKDELYPCKSDIFKLTYEKVDDGES
jgi:hypothetical protein